MKMRRAGLGGEAPEKNWDWAAERADLLLFGKGLLLALAVGALEGAVLASVLLTALKLMGQLAAVPWWAAAAPLAAGLAAFGAVWLFWKRGGRRDGKRT